MLPYISDVEACTIRTLLRRVSPNMLIAPSETLVAGYVPNILLAPWIKIVHGQNFMPIFDQPSEQV